MTKEADAATAKHELTITRLIDAPRDRLYRAWTEPELLKQWFAPRPYTTKEADLDVRTGGSNHIVMCDPDGNEMPGSGVYLEVVENEKIVFTDAFTSAWIPSDKPFFVGIITFEEEGGMTRYTARARHWTAQDCETHRQMGFEEGWGQCADQLAEVVSKL